MPQRIVVKANQEPDADGKSSDGGCGSVLTRPRKEFSRATRLAAWERANGQCEGMIPLETWMGDWWIPGAKNPMRRCNAPIDIGCFHYDHVDPVFNSDDNSLSNCQCLCRPCHKAKTKQDVKAIAKVKRIRDKRIKALTSKRPMPGSRKDWRKRKMNGQIVDRRTGRII